MKISSERIDARGTTALVLNTVFWSITPVLLKRLTVFIDPWTANGLRYPMAAVLFWPVLLRGFRTGALDRRLLVRALIPAFFAGAGQIFWAQAPYHIQASDIGFFIKVSLVWAFAGSMAFFPEERALLTSRRFWVGLALALGGFVALAVERGALEARVTWTGLAIILSCSVFFGLYGVSVRLLLRDVPPLLAFGIVAQLVAIGTAALMFCYGDVPGIPQLAGEAWVLLAATALIGITISHVLFYVAVLRIGASLTNATHLSGPFITCAVAYFALGERLGLRGWIAGIVLVSGGAFLLWAQERVRERMRERAESAGR